LIVGSTADELLVFDLPQIHTKPAAKELLQVLSRLSLKPQSWDRANNELKRVVERQQIATEGIPKYLISIVSSDLRWIKDEAEREEIWDEASLRLAERSGRTGMPAISRTFTIPTQTGHVGILIHEPSLTEDRLGFKTWAASYMLAKRLCGMSLPLPKDGPLRILELGSGTGLVGMAAAAVLQADVLLTDLSDIESNLARNVAQNLEMIESEGGTATTAVLDWTCPDRIIPSLCPSPINSSVAFQRFPVILAADSIYSADHPSILVGAIATWLSRSTEARVILELPLREGYASEREDLRQRMVGLGLEILEQGEEVGYDDWGGMGGELLEVPCWWTIWGWRTLP
jgi:hypothetical protein